METNEPRSSSIQKGSRKGGVRITTRGIVILLVIILAASGVGAYLAFGNRAPPELVRIDGSSTVYPITSAWAAEFNNPGRQVVVAFSGTGGGFSKFCRGETDLSDASRPIKQSERDACTASGITGVVGFNISFDGLSVVVNHGNTWADHLTVDQLCRIWTQNTSSGACGGAGGQVNQWNELDSSWPARKIKLYGPGTASGTFDYFVEVILTNRRTNDRIRSDFIGSEDDNVLVSGIANDLDALGYFGYAYVVENTSRVKALAIDDGNATNGAGPIFPSEPTIKDGTYAPLSRPLFIYASNRSLGRTVVKDFLRFGFSDRGTQLVGGTGYVSLTPAQIAVEVAKIPP